MGSKKPMGSSLDITLSLLPLFAVVMVTVISRLDPIAFLQRRIDEICAGKRAVTADTALRLDRLLGMDAQTWMNLQAQYDLEIAARDVGKRIEHEV